MAKSLRKENHRDRRAFCIRPTPEYPHPTPGVFCASLSIEGVSENQRAQVFENKGAENGIVCELNREGRFLPPTWIGGVFCYAAGRGWVEATATALA